MNWTDIAVRSSPLRSRLAEMLFGDLIDAAVQNAVKVVDDKWWTTVTDASAPNDLKWAERQTNLADALEAWRLNPIARQLVRLTRGFVLQDGISFRAKRKKDQKFIDEFWHHKRSNMPQRLTRWCDALTLFGEIFPVLFFNHADGMSYVRNVPAKAIDDIHTRPGDYETALSFHQLTQDLEGRTWQASESVMDGWAGMPENRPEMLHFAVNVPDGGLRGSGDLDPILSWLGYYKSWLTDRWTLNKAKSNYVWDLTVEGADGRELARRKRDLEKAASSAGGYYVHNEKETLNVLYPNIAGDTSEPDGKAFRLMIVAGGGVSLHHLGENDSLTRASSGASDRGTLSHYTARQNDLIGFCVELIDRAAWRAAQVGRVRYPSSGGFQVEAEVAEATREDNLMLAQATASIVSALAEAKAQGWMDDQTAMTMLLKFAGEAVDVQKIVERIADSASRMADSREAEANEVHK